MRIVMFYHSLRSDWNHGNAHFLRGIVRQLVELDHDVVVYEQRENWSRWNLKHDHGPQADEAYREAYPELSSVEYEQPEDIDLDSALDGADLVLVHEWGASADLFRRLSEHRRRRGGYRLLFHDTHHRGVTKPQEIHRYDLSGFDGALVFGEVLRELYLKNGWAKRAWTWHEAADVTVFKPRPRIGTAYDLVWIGNWGDEERTAELHEYLLGPVQRLGLKAKVWGVRYPDHARAALTDAGIEYGGYIPNHRVPEVFAQAKVTVHVPRRPYVEALPGIPTIRPFEALACGIPLVCSPWNDAEGLFTVGEDFLMVEDGEGMDRALKRILGDEAFADALAARGRETLLTCHTCRHRVNQLLDLCKRDLGLEPAAKPDSLLATP